MSEGNEVRGNRSHKDTVFRMLFREKRELLSLYNAMNGSAYTDPEALEIVTLENAVYMNMKNDLAFLADFHLYLYEHQSTVNSNMPLRFLVYVAKEYERLILDDSLYRKKKVIIPPPRFVVFYNGVDCLPEKSEQKLSEAYGEGEDNPMLELKVQILNINEGNNEVLKQHCRTLKEYMQYVDCVRKNAEGLSVQEAVIRAVDECIRNGVLAEFLQKNKAEVIPMSIFEYDEEKALKAIRADEFELGMEVGIKKGIEQGMEQGIEQGIELGVARSIGMVIKFCAELGISKRDTAAKIEETFGLKEADVQKYIKEYWK